MKFRMLLSALLLAAGIVFVAGCGKKGASAGNANSGAAATDPVTVVQNDALCQELEFAWATAHTVQVTDDYVLVCGYGHPKGKGSCQIAFHLKKQGGQWKIVDWEDNWEPKDKYK